MYDLLFKEEAEPKHGDDAIKARNLARSLVLGAFESITVSRSKRVKEGANKLVTTSLRE